MTAMKNIILLAGILMLFSMAAMAQAVTASDESSAIDWERREELLGLHYIPANFKTFAQLSWRYNLHPTSYDEAIDRYIKIINCPLYQNYYGSDFLWQRIREGMRKEIQYFAPSFPDRFELTGGIELGRYDFRRSAFILPEKYKLSRAGFIRLPTEDAYETDCSFTGYRTIFPVAMQVAAENPFTFVEIPVSPDDAKPLLERLAQYRYRNVTTNRMAMLRIRLKITGIRNYSNDTISPSLTFRGQLDEIAVFEDPQMTKIIWSKNFKDLN